MAGTRLPRLWPERGGDEGEGRAMAIGPRQSSLLSRQQRYADGRDQSFESSLEELALAQANLRRLQAERDAREREMELQRHELEALHDHRVEQRARTEAVLAKYLSSTALLGELGGEASVLGRAALPELGVEGDSYRLMDDALHLRQQRFLEAAMERDEKLQVLSEERRSILQRRRELEERKAQMFEAGELDLHAIAQRQAQEHEPTSVIVRRTSENLLHLEREVVELRDRLGRPPNRVAAREYGGELGPQSYWPHQIELYHWLHGVVLDLADRAVEYTEFEMPDPAGTQVADTAWHHDKDELMRQVLLAQAEVNAWDIYADLQKETVDEAAAGIFRELERFRKLSQSLTSKWIVAALPVRQPGSESTLTAALDDMRRAQRRSLPVVRHTLVVKRQRQPGKSQAAGGVDKPADDPDVTKISLAPILPFAVQRDATKPKKMPLYQAFERARWQGLGAVRARLDASKQCSGGTSLVVPSNAGHRLLIAGNHGHLSVWAVERQGDACQFACVRRTGKSHRKLSFAKARQAVWSLDDKRVVVLDANDAVRVWSLAQPSHPKRRLELVLVAEWARADFKFVFGPFVGQLRGTSCKPVRVAFASHFTVLGQQPQVVVALSNGDMLLCMPNQGVEEAANRVFPANVTIEGDASLIGPMRSPTPSHLFRDHRSPVVLVDFVRGTWPMVSVDHTARISLWYNDTDSLSGFGWRTPRHKVRLVLSETVYLPAPNAVAKVHFASKPQLRKKKKHALSKFELQQERSREEARLKRLNIAEPPHSTERGKDGTVTCLYAPSRVMAQGAVFHIIRRSATGLLLEHATMLYRPQLNRCHRILGVQMSSTKADLVFALLFATKGTRGPHISFVLVSLPTLSVNRMRVDVALSEPEYGRLASDRDSVVFRVSGVSSATGSDYLFARLSGRLRVFSLTSGEEMPHSLAVHPHDAQLCLLPFVRRQIVVVESLARTAKLPVHAVTLGQGPLVPLSDSELPRLATQTGAQRRAHQARLIHGLPLATVTRLVHELVGGIVDRALAAARPP